MSTADKFVKVLRRLETMTFEEGQYVDNRNSRYTLDNLKHQLTFKSMPDGSCFFHALAICLGIKPKVGDPDNFLCYWESYVNALGRTGGGVTT